MQVRFYATLRAVVGSKTIDVDVPAGARAIDLARAIALRWPALADRLIDDRGGLSRQVHLLIDGRNVRWLPAGSSTRLHTDSTIDVFPPTAGG